MTFTAAELRRIKRGKPSHWGLATWVKHLALLCSSNAELLGVTRSDLAFLEVTTPDPAHARDTVSSPTTSKSNTAPDTGNGTAGDGLAALLRRLDWYGAKFTATTTAAVLAEKLIDTFPKVDHQQAAREASAWLLANPSKRKKYVSRFLIGWFKNAGKPAPWEPQTELPAVDNGARERASLAAERKRSDQYARDKELAMPQDEQVKMARGALEFLKTTGGETK